MNYCERNIIVHYHLLSVGMTRFIDKSVNEISIFKKLIYKITKKQDINL